MDNGTKQLRIISYNSTGCNDDKLRYLNASSKSCDIIFVQEHWLLKDNLHKIKCGIDDFTGIANSGVDENQMVLQGRPYGGCAILYHSLLQFKQTPYQGEYVVLHLTFLTTKCC